jgi:hypothetical protein
VWQVIGFIGMYVLRVQFGIDHLTDVHLFIGYLSVTVVFILFLNQSLARHFYLSLVKPSMAVFILLQIIIYLTYRHVNPNIEIISQYKNVHFAYLAPVYQLTKMPDIVFQQLAFGLFFYDMKDRGYSLRTTQLITALFLFVSHFFTLLSMPVMISVVFIGCSGIAGFLFPYLTLRHGFFASMSLHWAYYFLLGLVFCTYAGAF